MLCSNFEHKNMKKTVRQAQISKKLIQTLCPIGVVIMVNHERSPLLRNVFPVSEMLMG